MKFHYVGLNHKTQQVHFPILTRKVAKKHVSENRVSEGHPELVLPNSLLTISTWRSQYNFLSHTLHIKYICSLYVKINHGEMLVAFQRRLTLKKQLLLMVRFPFLINFYETFYKAHLIHFISRSSNSYFIHHNIIIFGWEKIK